MELDKFYYLSYEKRLEDFICFKFNNNSICRLIHYVLFPYAILCGSIAIIIGKYIKLNLNKKKKKSSIAITTIAKNEADYIAEWVIFHKLIGVDHIYLYDNDSTDNMKQKIQPLIDEGFVTLIPIHGLKKQLIAYNHSLQKYGHLYRYMAFIDCDEFIMPLQKSKITDIIDCILSKDKNAGGIAVNWCMYGSSGYKVKPLGLLTENFIYHSKLCNGKGNDCIKSIVIPDCVKKFTSPHYPIFKFGFYNIDVFNRPVFSWRNIIREYQYLRINHYFTKSLDQWIKRRALGKADLGTDDKRTIDEFYAHDKNDVYEAFPKQYSDAIKNMLNKYNIKQL